MSSLLVYMSYDCLREEPVERNSFTSNPQFTTHKLVTGGICCRGKKTTEHTLRKLEKVLQANPPFLLLQDMCQSTNVGIQVTFNKAYDRVHIWPVHPLQALPKILLWL